MLSKRLWSTARDRIPNCVFSFPAWATPSMRVDLRQLIAGVRPAIRVEVRTPSYNCLKWWAARRGWYAHVDCDGFAMISTKPGLARRLLQVDRRSGSHAFQLGIGLGYPRCCARAAERVGEASIDAWSRTMGERTYVGAFRIINPKDYLFGKSVLSHVPCGPRCVSSMRMGLAVLEVLRPR